MNSLLSLNNVSYQAGNKVLFTDLTLNISPQSRLGVIGPNGSGKSTLLKILNSKLEPDAGKLISSADHIAYVSQRDEFDDQQTIVEFLTQEMAKKFSGHELDRAVESAFELAGFADKQAKISTLSGGWRKRLAITAAVFSNSDVILFDEPTNHLDLAGLIWLEKILAEASFAWVLVSHDRYFLQKTAREFIEIAPYYSKGYFVASGSYQDFISKRSEYLESIDRQIASMENKLRIEMDWVARQPSARGTKADYRVKEAYRLQAELSEIKQRHKFENFDVSFVKSDRETVQLVKISQLGFAYQDKPIVSNLDFIISSKMCLGILGDNGQGKSTLLKLIGGKLAPQKGKVKPADGLKVFYFDQLRQTLNSDSTLGEVLADGNDQVLYGDKYVHIISWAKKFGFSKEDLVKKIKELSGGQQARVLLANLAKQKADLLILDEPSNDLDIIMLEALEKMIAEFSGAVILVTHDRYMISKVCTHFLGYTKDQRLLTYGSFEQWQADCFELKNAANVAQAVAAPKTNKSHNKNKKQIEKVERQIAKIENEQETLSAKVAETSDAQAAMDMAAQLQSMSEQLEALYVEWEKLHE